MQPSPNATNSNPALSAALKGATLAFQAQQKSSKPSDRPAKPKPPSPAAAADSGALRAATQAARRDDSRHSQGHLVSSPGSPTRSPARSPARTGSRQSQDQGLGLVGQGVSRNATGGSGAGSGYGGGEFLGVPSGGVGRQAPGSEGSRSPDARASASFIAATLAASRSGSPTRGGTPSPGVGQQQQLSGRPPHARVMRRPSLGGGSGSWQGGESGSVQGGEREADEERTQPTGSLIELFEGRKGKTGEGVDVDPVKRRRPRLERPRSPERLERSVLRGGEKRKPNPPPKVVVKSPTFREEDGKEEGGGRSLRVDSETDVGGQGREDPGSRGQRRDATQQQDDNAKKQVNPPVAPKKPRITSMIDSTKKRDTTPHPINQARRPVPELVSPEPRKVVKSPKLDPPQAPPKASAVREAVAPKHTLSQSSASSDDSFVSASSTQSPRAKSPANREPPSPSPNRNMAPSTLRPAQVSPFPSPLPGLGHKQLSSSNSPSNSNSSLALDSLTNAIVASNLASARLGTQSTSPGPPPLPAPRRHHHHHHPHLPHRSRSPQHLKPQRTADSLTHHHTGGSSKSPSGRHQPQQPRTGMLRTLRAPHSSLSDDEDARRRSHRTRKKTMHPLSGGKKHAHNEGSRRRWRDEVSARERRRYEAVWASNRGLFLRPGWGYSGGGDEGRAGDGTPQAELVVNVVVRDLWSRSRLPEDELAEVWELVDKRGDGSLGREEFVVGMWLIDQRLKGRKIPARVGESVWVSVRGVAGQGVVVPGPKGKGKRR